MHRPCNKGGKPLTRLNSATPTAAVSTCPSPSVGPPAPEAAACAVAMLSLTSRRGLLGPTSRQVLSFPIFPRPCLNQRFGHPMHLLNGLARQSPDQAPGHIKSRHGFQLSLIALKPLKLYTMRPCIYTFLTQSYSLCSQLCMRDGTMSIPQLPDLSRLYLNKPMIAG